ncbi:MAG TPA: (2Fe-2S)-binding protein [Caldilinea sp.]|nr:(2Fe-2S)-binding protein [Caldilinea sp.]
MNLRINGTEKEIDGGPGALLVYVLRDELGMTGTKIGCAAGICGSCTVLVDGVATRSCITPLTLVEGKEITTIEGLATENADGTLTLHPVQQAFIDAQVPQCGWCMSGQIMTAAAFLQQNPAPSEDDVIEAMGENYCRCGCYHRIRQAVVAAAGTMNGVATMQEVSA